MDTLNNYAGLISIVSLIILAVIGVFILVICFDLKGRISSARLNFVEHKDINSDDGKETFTIIVANRALNDMNIAEIGLYQKNSFVDFAKRYREQNNLSENAKIIIPQRSSIKLVLEIDEVEQLHAKICTIKWNSKMFWPKFGCYAIDTSGNKSMNKAKNISNITKKDYFAKLEAKKAEQKRLAQESKTIEQPTQENKEE